MKTSVISLIALAAVATAAAVQPGAHSNTNAVPNIVVSPPGDGNGAIDNTVRPNDNNRLGQYWMQYGICDTRTRKTTCKIQSIPSGKRWVGYKCRNKGDSSSRLRANGMSTNAEYLQMDESDLIL
ncbi:hypothetical protein BDV32DRAFT_145459 [Aspergillus pseudonomiae]|nr:hypothetical protein BDV32DRAFT_145459 [Aspergillus pseudonomiae]